MRGLDATEENIFIAAACDRKGIDFLKGDSPLMVRKKGNETENSGGGNMSGNYTVVVDGKRYSVQVAEGDARYSSDSSPHHQSQRQRRKLQFRQEEKVH